MIKRKAMQTVNEIVAPSQFDVNQLIDLFVELNFDNIKNESLLMQFKIVAIQIGYPMDMIDRVIKLGKSEYSKLMAEINQLKPLDEVVEVVE